MGYIKSKAKVSCFMVLGQCFMVVEMLPHVQCIITILPQVVPRADYFPAIFHPSHWRLLEDSCVVYNL